MSTYSDELKYLLWVIVLLFVLGSFTFIVSSFSSATAQTYSGWASPLVSFVKEGYNFNLTIPIPILPNLNLNFKMNPFGILGGDIQSKLADQTVAFGLLPSWLAIPIIIYISISILYFIIKIIQGFIP